MKLGLFNFPKLESPKLLSWIMVKNYLHNFIVNTIKSYSAFN